MFKMTRTCLGFLNRPVQFVEVKKHDNSQACSSTDEMVSCPVIGGKGL